MLPALDVFHARFNRFYLRSGGRDSARKYLIGLTLPIERKNAENIAERVESSSRKMQEFLSESPWDDEGCIGELQRFVGERFGDLGGVLILDDTGFAKKGTHSAGVGRQYSGTLGRVDNCQIGVFLCYAGRYGHTLVDRRLYLMKEWFTDKVMRGSSRADVPADVIFKTKLQMASEMLASANTWGHLPYRWVTADAAYGNSHDLRQLVTEQGRLYCFEVSKAAQVWTVDPEVWTVDPEVWTVDPEWQILSSPGKRGRPRTHARPQVDSPRSETVDKVVRALPDSAWIRHHVTDGDKGPREYEFVRIRVIEKINSAPGQWGWLMGRRPVGSNQKSDIKYYLSNAPEDTSLEEMATVGCLRWTIEENFKLAKGEVGLDHYEVTKYRGWYHHITMSLLALAFLKSVQREWRRNGAIASVPEVRQLLEVVLPLERWDAIAAIAWYEGQQRRKVASRASHARRWEREHPWVRC